MVIIILMTLLKSIIIKLMMKNNIDRKTRKKNSVKVLSPNTVNHYDVITNMTLALP